jgi:hypothetical protein
LLAAKTGARNNSDIVWVGPAANYASKLNSFEGLDITCSTRISEAVWNAASAAWQQVNGWPLWEQITRAF